MLFMSAIQLFKWLFSWSLISVCFVWLFILPWSLLSCLRAFPFCHFRDNISCWACSNLCCNVDDSPSKWKMASMLTSLRPSELANCVAKCYICASWDLSNASEQVLVGRPRLCYRPAFLCILKNSSLILFTNFCRALVVKETNKFSSLRCAWQICSTMEGKGLILGVVSFLWFLKSPAFVVFFIWFWKVVGLLESSLC